jgi:hypothetical protein
MSDMHPTSKQRHSLRVGFFGIAICVMMIAAVALAVLDVVAAPLRVRAGGGPSRDDASLVSNGRHALSGGVAAIASSDQTSTGGRWRVQGRMMPVGQAETAVTPPSTTMPREQQCIGGIDGVLLVLAQWGECRPRMTTDPTGQCAGDVDADGQITARDLQHVIAAW